MKYNNEKNDWSKRKKKRGTVEQRQYGTHRKQIARC